MFQRFGASGLLLLGDNVLEYALDWTVGNIAISPTVKTTLVSLAFRDEVRVGFSARPTCGQVGSALLYITTDFRPTPHWRTGCMMTLVISWLCVVWLVSQCLCLKWFLSLFFRNLFLCFSLPKYRQVISLKLKQHSSCLRWWCGNTLLCCYDWNPLKILLHLVLPQSLKE